jgi:hypothetical protein
VFPNFWEGKLGGGGVCVCRWGELVEYHNTLVALTLIKLFLEIVKY